MSEKMGCPVCGSYTSSIATAVDEGSPCPVCGCPAAIIREVARLHEYHEETKLTVRVEEVLIENAKLRIERDKLKRIVDAVRQELRE